MKILKNILLLVLVVLVSIMSASFFGDIYESMFTLHNFGFGSFFAGVDDYMYFDGLIPAYTFLILFLYTAIGVGRRYIWMFVLLIPALAFVLYFDISRIWFYALVGIVGWLMGLGVRSLITR